MIMVYTCDKHFFFFLQSATACTRFWLAQLLSSNCLYSVLLSSNCICSCTSSSSFFILLTSLGRPKIICPAFPHWAWRTRICLGLSPIDGLQDKHYHTYWTFSARNSWAGIDSQEFTPHCPGRCHPDDLAIAAASLWDRKCNTYGTCECRLPLDCMDNKHWRCHNCSCEMRPVEKLTQYCVRMGNISTKGPQSASRPGLSSPKDAFGLKVPFVIYTYI
jgi:hypothetical protein